MSYRISRGVLHPLVAALVLVLTSLATTLYAENLHTGLISYWRLNEGGGATATDTGPGGFVSDNGELRNGPTWINGQFGTGLQFNGTDQDVLIPASTDMDMNSSGLTLSAWVKLDQLPSEIAGSFSGIYDSGPDNYVFYLDKGSNELRFKATTSTGNFERPGILARDLDKTSWHHVMGVYDSTSGSMEIYFDGQLADRMSTLALQNDIIRSGQVASIGGQPAAAAPHAPGNLFQGGITDVAVWNRALGLAEAQYLYNNGTGNAVGAANPNINPTSLTPVQPTAQPVIYYNFEGNLNNNGTGGAALDATLVDVPGRNDSLYTSRTFGQGLDLRENPAATQSASPEGGGDYLSVNYKLADTGTIAMRASIEQVYNFQSLWANSSHGDDWEAWIYSDGRIAARADRGTARMEHNIFLLPDQASEHHYAFTWERNGDRLAANLYIDGKLQGTVEGAWRDPGETFFIGGGTGNTLASATFDEVRVYETALDAAEILYLSQNAPATEFLTGDYNSDGIVDAADYLVWRNTLNTSVAAGTGADGNNNGTIDSGDYTLWKQNYGMTSGQAALSTAAVPEPASLAVALLATVCLGAGIRRRAVS